jgi:hypothetical protein
MPDWLDAIPNLGVPGVPGVPAQKTAGYSGTPQKTAGVPGVPVTARPAPAPTADKPKQSPYAALKRWEASLAALTPNHAPEGVYGERWRSLLDDAAWLFRRHGLQLAQEGWSDLDAFGVSTRLATGEVLLDRLDGSRRLHLDGKGRGAWGWSYTSVIMQACIGYAGLQPAGAIVPVWGLAGHG